MKYFIILFYLLSTLPANAALTDVDKTQIFSKNIMPNGGFELGKSGWTPNDTADFAVTTSSPMVGLVHATWDADASTDTLAYNAFPIQAGYFGRNGVASCVFTTASGTATVEIQATDGSNVLSETTITSSTSPTRTSTNFIFPSSGSIQLRLYANADEPSVAIDDCYLGPAEGYNVSNVSQSRLVGVATYPATASCAWARTNTSAGEFTADTDAPAPTVTSNPGPGTISTTDNNLPQITITNLPPGVYNVKATVGVVQGASAVGVLQINDGTTTGPRIGFNSVNTTNESVTVTATFTYTTAQSSITYKLYGLTSSSSLTIDCANYDSVFEIYRFPTTQETAYTADVTNWLVNVNIAGANPALSTSSVSSYTGIEDAGLTLTNHSSATITARIPCSSTNSPSGTTCSVGSESVGVNFNLPKAGSVEACATFGHYFVIASNSADNSLNYTFQFVETASNAQTVLTEGGGRGGTAQGGRFAAGTAIYGGINRTCSIFKFSSAGEKTLRLMYEQVVGGTINSNLIIADAAATAGARDIQITVKPVDQSFPAPNLVNSVVSPSSGVEKIASVFVTDGAVTTTISRETGDWIDGVCTNPSTGRYVCTFVAGTFSNTPNCLATTLQSGGGAYESRMEAISSSSVEMRFYTNDGTLADSNFTLFCMGPK